MDEYYIYCRKSSEAEDRQVLSIQSQIRELQQLASKLKLPVKEILTESKSAKEPGRPVFNSLMQSLSRGEAAGIICWKLDRLARNPVDGGSVIWAIKQNGIKVVTPGQSYEREQDNAILMYIEFGMAQKYVDDLSRNVKIGLKTKIENGWYPGVAPPGYLNVMDRQTGESRLAKDPERFLLIRRMWDLMLTGLYTPPKILKIANTKWAFRTRRTRKLGGGPLPRSTIYKIFNKPFYYGWFEYPKGSERWHRGKHEPMISKTEYDQVQAFLGRKGNPRVQSHSEFTFTGLIRCGGCGLMVTAEEKRQVICANCRLKFAHGNRNTCPRCETHIEKMSNPRFRRYTYYHCSKSNGSQCRQRCVSEERLEAQIDEYLARIQISERFKQWAIAYLHELHRIEGSARDNIIQAQRKAYQECLSRIDNLVNLKTSPGNTDGRLLSDEEYARQRGVLLKEKTDLEQLLHGADQQAEHAVRLCEQIFEIACMVRTRFAKGDTNTKRTILTTVGSNLTLKDKKLCLEARKPFFILGTSLSAGEQENRAIEPENTGLTQRRNEPNRVRRPLLRGGRHDVRTFGPRMKKLVRSIYRFFRNAINSPKFNLSDWEGLNHKDET